MVSEFNEQLYVISDSFYGAANLILKRSNNWSGDLLDEFTNSRFSVTFDRMLTHLETLSSYIVDIFCRGAILSPAIRNVEFSEFDKTLMGVEDLLNYLPELKELIKEMSKFSFNEDMDNDLLLENYFDSLDIWFEILDILINVFIKFGGGKLSGKIIELKNGIEKERDMVIEILKKYNVTVNEDGIEIDEFGEEVE